MAQLNKLRLGLLVMVPALAVGAIAYLSIHFFLGQQLKAHAAEYGEATIVPVAELVAEYVEHENVVALTLLATKLRDETPIESIEIYDAGDGLLARAGRDSGGDSFSRQLTYQDTTIGRIRITVNAPANQLSPLSLLPPVAGLLAIALILWRAFAPVAAWLQAADPGPQPAHQTDPEPEAAVQANAVQVNNGGGDTVLVVKIRPARYLDKHRDTFEEAVRLHNGDTRTVAGQDELVAVFKSPFESACAGLLIRQLADDLPGDMAFGGALQASADEPAARKGLSHLASIADGQVLANEAIFQLMPPGQFAFDAFRHALIDTDNMIQVRGLNGSDLIESQAAWLATSGRGRM